MSRFCTHCGSPLEEKVKFCSACGSAAAETNSLVPFASDVSASGDSGSAPRTSAVQASAAQSPASPTASPVVKILLVLLVIFVLIILAVMGSCAYAGYRIKKKAEQIQQSYKKSGLEQLARAVGNGANAKRRNENSVCPPYSEGTEAQSALTGTAHIPLGKGLTLVKAWSRPEGDEETITRITSIDRDAVHVSASGTGNVPGFGTRAICKHDLQSAHNYITGFGPDFAEVLPGSTMFSMSADMFRDLTSKGATMLTYVEYESTLGVPLESRSGGIMSRVEPTSVNFPVIVNDQRVELPTIHIRGKLETQDAEAFVVDDLRNPLMLRFVLGGNAIQIVKISYAQDTKSGISRNTNAISEKPAQGSEGGPRIERALQETGRAEVYGIYFDFGKADIRPESEPVLKEIADALGNNPAWKLSVEGHTDNIGGDAYNQDLSNRRATAVKGALVERYRIHESRLTTSGFGAMRPKESNDTLEGRARNRRVELVRQ